MHPYAPSPEHEFLQRKVGVWDIECEYFFDPTSDPMKAAGVDTVEAIGLYWVQARSEFELPGEVILRGVALTGFDPVVRMYQGTWVDSATPFLYTFEGNYDAERDLLELTGENIDPATGELVTYRSKEYYGGADARIFELMVEAEPGLETQILRYEYTRRR
ncbi:MAG: DUF1579 family protein [Planctomycetota bacterium]|jgi:hypothetical protein